MSPVDKESEILVCLKNQIKHKRFRWQIHKFPDRDKGIEISFIPNYSIYNWDNLSSIPLTVMRLCLQNVFFRNNFDLTLIMGGLFSHKRQNKNFQLYTSNGITGAATILQIYMYIYPVYLTCCTKYIFTLASHCRTRASRPPEL